MALLKFLRRKDTPEAADAARRGDRASSQTSPASEAVARARQQARRRLMGAVVLLGIGVIGFPILFQTQPRPIPVDLPIEIPRKDKVPPLEIPAARSASEGEGRGMGQGAAPTPALAAAPEPVQPPSQGPGKPLTDKQATEKSPTERAQAEKSPSEKPSPPVTETVVEASPAKASAASAPSAAPAASAEAAASKKASAAAASEPAASDADARARFIVQVGAFAENDKVREVRTQLERMGLKTYTQEVTVNGERRVRVRLGPFKTRQEAADVLARIKAAGLPGALLAL